MLYLFPGPREAYVEELQFLGEEDNVNYQLVSNSILILTSVRKPNSKIVLEKHVSILLQIMHGVCRMAPFIRVKHGILR